MVSQLAATLDAAFHDMRRRLDQARGGVRADGSSRGERETAPLTPGPSPLPPPFLGSC